MPVIVSVHDLIRGGGYHFFLCTTLALILARDCMLALKSLITAVAGHGQSGRFFPWIGFCAKRADTSMSGGAKKFSVHVSDRVKRESEGGTDAWARIIEWSKKKACST